MPIIIQNHQIGDGLKMTIKIDNFTIDSGNNSISPPYTGEKKEKQVFPLVYWGIYLNNERISYTSSKQLAEKTKSWMENWLKDKS